jgi:prepilin-type N-terminal cleavage/methylation domain-containing protein
MLKTHNRIPDTRREAALRGIAVSFFQPCVRSRRGFTLFEILIVVAIIGIIGGIGIPSIVRSMQKEGMRKAISDIEEICTRARRTAIFTGKTTELVLNTREKTLTVGGASASEIVEDPDAPKKPSNSVRLPDNITIEAIDLYGLDYTEEEQVRVRFKPNGTAEEFKLVLRADDGEQMGIEVDLVTAKTNVERDLRKWMR